MATIENTTIRLCAGVPLVKGGTEVLYLTGQAALAQLTPYTKATCTEYYFVRENRRAVQVDLTYAECEGVNYIVFRNRSHGDKLFFAFVDEIVYINDNCTEIRFTIDPFPTYLEDTSLVDHVIIIRNTYKNPTRTSNFIRDFQSDTVKKTFTNLYHRSIPMEGYGVVYYAVGASLGDVEIGSMGIYAGQLTPTKIKQIKDEGGVIIGAYFNPYFGDAAFNHFSNLINQEADIVIQPLQGVDDTVPKLKTGVYNSLTLLTSSSAKTYDIEDFSDPENVTFGQLWCNIPSPMLFIYPKNYRGVVDNVTEGITVKTPALPVTANATYTNAEFFSDLKNAGFSAASGAIAGAALGGGWGALAGAASGIAGGVANMGVHAVGKMFDPPTVFGTGEPMLSWNRSLNVDIVRVSPSGLDQAQILTYLDYYGYAVNSEWLGVQVNTDDKAYLQTGSEFLHGSEADAELNARIMAGIKIKKTLS